MKSTKNPLVSIVMPVYNAMPYLRQAVQSIMAQTYTNWELIAVNDCSTDTSLRYLKRMAKKDPRIKVFHNETNMKIGATMNRALKEAQGTFIARMDADDIAAPERIREQVTFLQQNKDIGIVGSAMIEIDSDGKPYATRIPPFEDKEIRERLFTRQTIQNPTLMIRKSAIPARELRYDEYLSPVDDLDFFFRAIRHTKAANIPQYLMYYRKHDTNSSLMNIKETFAKTQSVRDRAVLTYGHMAPLKQKMIQFVQTSVATLLPNRVLYPLFKLIAHHRIQEKHFPLWMKGSKTRRRKPAVSIVMPAFMAASVIEQSIKKALSVLSQHTREYELIVVVDGSKDQTLEKARKLVKKHKHLIVTSYDTNKGKGFAVRYGFSFARYEYIGFLDCGTDIDSTSLRNLLKTIRENPEVDGFIGDKDHPLSIIAGIPWYRRLMSAVFKALQHMVVGIRLHDTQVGMKVFRSKVAEDYWTDLPYAIDGFAFDVELLAVTMQKKYQILPVSVAICRRNEPSTVRLRHIVQMTLDTLRIGLWYRGFMRPADRKSLSCTADWRGSTTPASLAR